MKSQKSIKAIIDTLGKVVNVRFLNAFTQSEREMAYSERQQYLMFDNLVDTSSLSYITGIHENSLIKGSRG